MSKYMYGWFSLMELIVWLLLSLGNGSSRWLCVFFLCELIDITVILLRRDFTIRCNFTTIELLPRSDIITVYYYADRCRAENGHNLYITTW